jgi:hypothetical protein
MTEIIDKTAEQPTKEPVKEPAKEEPTAAEVQDEILAALLGKIKPATSTKEHLKVLLYSKPGQGKSTFLGTAENSLILDDEDGLASLSNHPDIVKESAKAYPYKSFEGTEILIKYLKDRNPAFDWVETFSVDSMSTLHKKGLEEVTEREWRKNPLANNRYKAETDHHTENNEHIRRLVSSLNDLDRNIILTAHARTVEPSNQPPSTFPDFSEKLANAIAGIVDMVVYMEIREIEGEPRRVFRFHTQNNAKGQILAKSRIGGFPEEAMDVTWDDFLRKFQDHLAKNDGKK